MLTCIAVAAHEVDCFSCVGGEDGSAVFGGVPQNSEPHKVVAWLQLQVHVVVHMDRLFPEHTVVTPFAQEGGALRPLDLPQLKDRRRVFVVLIVQEAVEALRDSQIHRSLLFEAKSEVKVFLWT